MDIDTVRDRATAFCAALDAGNVEAATAFLSPELQRNLGEVLALMPLPTNESTVGSVDRSGSGCNVVLRLLGETDEVELQTRWKDRDGEPTLVEVSHLSQTQRDEGEATAEDEEGASAGPEG
jgi:hypothetical protein